MAMTELPANDIGVALYNGWSNEMNSDPIDVQFQKAGVEFETGEIEHLVGMAGHARLLWYVSPKTDQPVTVLIIPVTGGDWFGEDYYYFTGLTKENAIALGEPEWIRRYDLSRTLRDQAISRMRQEFHAPKD